MPPVCASPTPCLLVRPCDRANANASDNISSQTDSEAFLFSFNFCAYLTFTQRNYQCATIYIIMQKCSFFSIYDEYIPFTFTWQKTDLSGSRWSAHLILDTINQR